MWISLGFVIGCISTVFYYETLEFIIITVSIVIIGAYFKPFLSLLLGFICGICIVIAHYHIFYNFEHIINDEKYAYPVEVVIQEVISNKAPQYVKAKLVRINGKYYSNLSAPSAMLSVNLDQPLRANDRFVASVNLKKFRSNKNFNVFDNELYAFKQRIFFKGKVLNKELKIKSTSEQNSVQSYKSFIKNTYENTTLNWLYYALLTGDKTLMTPSDKQLMQSLGLSHLLAISGLHIGLVFGFGFFITKWVFIHVKLFNNQTINFSIAYSAIGFVSAFVYVYLSNFLVSATRALIMLGCYLLLYYFQRQLMRWRSILFALVIVLVVNPFNTLNPGLYFSFFAVVVIFLVIKNVPHFTNSFLKVLFALITIQAALFIGLLPLSFYFFNGVSVAGLVINLVAIPFLSFILMPCLILLTAISAVFDISMVIIFIDSGLAFIFTCLNKLPAGFGWLNIGIIGLSVIIYAYLTLLIFYFSPYRRLAFLPLAMLYIDYLLADKPTWKLHVFDVGHGLMALIEKDDKGFIYDFGPSYFNRFSRAKSILLPFIDINNIAVTHSVVSHLDNDHSGGLSHFIGAGLKFSFNEFHPNGPSKGCIPNEVNMAGLIIKSFPSPLYGNENDESCVIKVSDKEHSVLFTGDISKNRESQLINSSDSLKSTVLLSPHHGSSTSSSNKFINAVMPQVVIHSSAYKGQWQFPKTEVVERYRNINALQYVTGQQGQITVEFYEETVTVITARDYQSYWFIKD